jgi:hypothetical protein
MNFMDLGVKPVSLFKKKEAFQEDSPDRYEGIFEDNDRNRKGENAQNEKPLMKNVPNVLVSDQYKQPEQMPIKDGYMSPSPQFSGASLVAPEYSNANDVIPSEEGKW